MTRVFSLFFAIAVLFTAFLRATSCTASVFPGKTDDFNLYLYSSGQPIYFIVVEKSSQRLLLFSQERTLKLLNRFICATGENPGTKLVSGDSRTPEGIYFITRYYEDKKITVFGSRAFHLDYPNIFDKNAGHNGDGIYIHGTNRQLLPFSTNGCITLNNDDLDILAPYLTVDTIPVVVVNTLHTPISNRTVVLTAHDGVLKDILTQFFPDIADIDRNLIETLTVFRKKETAIATLNYFSFDGDRIRYKNRKKMYLRRGHSTKWRTVHSIQSQNGIPTILAIHPQKTNLTEKTSPRTWVPQTDEKDEILNFIEQWRTAWSRKNISSYINCYSPSFRSGRLNLEKWRKKKALLNRKYAFIHVTLDNIKIKLTKNGAVVTFDQTYISDQYKTAGRKTLHLIRKNDKWQIQREYM
ncbi:L,D-transpeptidase family protein [Desulfomarina sp.]